LATIKLKRLCGAAVLTMGSPAAACQQVSDLSPHGGIFTKTLNTGRERGVALQSNYITDFSLSLSLLNEPLFLSPSLPLAVPPTTQLPAVHFLN
jgi:hypothetical protein